MMFKKLLLFTLVLCSLQSVQAQKFRRARDYMRFIGKQQELIVKSMWRYTQALSHSDNDRLINKKHAILIKSIDRAILKIEKAEGFDNDTIYKGKVLKNLEINKSLLLDDYGAVVDMQKVANDSYDAMEAYLLAQKLADKKMEEAQLEYEENFYAFAEKHGIEIVEDRSELGKNMQITNEVFDYYNALFLINFKVKYNESKLIEALEKQDLGSIQQSINALEGAIVDGLAAVDLTPLYKKDNRVAKTTKELFEFHNAQTIPAIREIVDYIVLKDDISKLRKAAEKAAGTEKYDKIKNMYDAKQESLEDQSAFLDKMLKKLERGRSKRYYKVDQALSKFLDKHVPVYTI